MWHQPTHQAVGPCDCPTSLRPASGSRLELQEGPIGGRSEFRGVGAPSFKKRRLTTLNRFHHRLQDLRFGCARARFQTSPSFKRQAGTTTVGHTSRQVRVHSRGCGQRDLVHCARGQYASAPPYLGVQVSKFPTKTYLKWIEAERTASAATDQFYARYANADAQKQLELFQEVNAAREEAARCLRAAMEELEQLVQALRAAR